ncbi:MAG: aminoacyl--tRNA ligase-related protein, partial [Bacilli bacterium]
AGALNGKLRVCTFTQDDAHIFVRTDQIEDEIAGIIDLIKQIYGVFGFSYQIELSTRPVDSMGSDGLWEAAETALQNVLASLGIPYRLNEGDGAFYGPKIDFHIRDALGRNWQCGTIQLDFQMPEKFDLNYIGEDNRKRRPVVIHRAIFGSIDRFIGILTEHFAGAFPLWLAPVQAKVVPVSDKFAEYAEAVRAKLVEAGLRADIDRRNEKIGYKIRETQMHKITYTLVVGKEEVAADAVAVRQYGKGDQGQMRVDDFLAKALTEAHDKTMH